ncbi:glycerophosphodiester phosphodiesterase family protein [Brachybacterium sp. FME24]|uniref:glycerophosphodiester phosphodiesterase n=1 Tax=Brachybacterium sp. FME24 TaxID=2742605 RepID=UPI0018664F8F|nr:glycerophosphodiester phosphodiesterase family protein [Brachybacterium sp. FME24]
MSAGTADAAALRSTVVPELVGHRGAAAVEPENTVLSFRRGLAEGTQLLECDVHVSSDGADVVIHDATIDRTAQEDSPLRTGAVADLTRAQLDRVLVGKGEHIPTLVQVLDAAVREDGTRVPLLVEIKAPAAAELATGILSTYFEPEVWDDPSTAPAYVISFHPEALRTAVEQNPRIPLLLTTTATSPEFFATAKELGVAQVGVRIADARQADVEHARELGVQLNLWTARSEEELARALELGCDTITVDDPAWAFALMAEQTATA